MLKPKVPVKRMVFHEITKEAIQRAKEATRELDTALVDAQETAASSTVSTGTRSRRCSGARSAPDSRRARAVRGRPVSSSTGERERLAFVSANYWDLSARFEKVGDTAFTARLARLQGTRVASGRDFDDRGVLKGEAVRLDEASAAALTAVLEGRRRRGRAQRRVEAVHASTAAPFTRRRRCSRRPRASSGSPRARP